ncbi:uncharacterized protein N7482_009505 [Penicillium canariense]|uniref:Uncharacterized protein n=1 Tax=Penicillium canariense TaxID=189055 RepID=A0A9W9HQC4_9EURO|nr:uncharacterized protein N7482_009505 [Penicillium canariense]KAJ5153027.1 hypothetical protein N7482_009505 [Penicillium canariense]
MIAPLLPGLEPVDGAAVTLLMEGVVEIELGSFVLVATSVVETGVEASDVVDDERVFEVVVELVLDDVDAEEVDVLDDELELASGQIPDVQGSLEQHPRKLPAEQTYHSCDPSQLVDKRRANASISKGCLGQRSEYNC